MSMGRPCVMKFGGSCLKSADDMRAAAGIISTYGAPVVVASAMNGVTQCLISAIGEKSVSARLEIISRLERQHMVAIRGIMGREIHDMAAAHLKEQFLVLRKAAAEMREDSREHTALIQSFGERFAATILSHYILQAGRKALAVNSEHIIISRSEDLLVADVDEAASAIATRQTLDGILSDGCIPVVTGFFCRSRSGKTALLGRNSSDYTAAFIASTYENSELVFWKDVPGLMTSDPKTSDKCEIVRSLSYESASDIIGKGARILHPKAIELCAQSGTIIRIRDFNHPESEGTTIASAAISPGPS